MVVNEVLNNGGVIFIKIIKSGLDADVLRA